MIWYTSFEPLNSVLLKKIYSLLQCYATSICE